MTKAMLKIILKIIIIVIFLGWVIYFSLCFTVDLPTFHIDGSFQTASGLFRLEAGQVFGKDFFSYLGVGVIACLYPVFKIFGSNLASSILASHLITVLFSYFSFTIIYKILFPNKSILTCFANCGAIYSILISLHTIFSIELPYINYSALEYSLYPGNSLRPIRGFAPYFGAFLLLYQDLSILKRFKPIFIGLGFSIVLLWSNDYAFSTVICYLVTYTQFLYAKSKKTSLIFEENLKFLGITSLLYFIFISIISHGHAFDIIKYNFDVSKDQWWYFASYSISSRVFNFRNLSHLISDSLDIYTPLILLALIIIMMHLKKDISYFLLTFTGSSTLMGGELPRSVATLVMVILMHSVYGL